MSEANSTPELNLKPRRAASAQSAARAYGTTQTQAVPGTRIPQPGPEIPHDAKRGFLATNWPLMTAASILMAGGVAMGMAVGSTGPKAQPIIVAAAARPPQQPVIVQGTAARPAALHIEGVAQWREREDAARQQVAVVSLPPAPEPPVPQPVIGPAYESEAQPAVPPAPERATLPQPSAPATAEAPKAAAPVRLAALTPPPAREQQKAVPDRGSPQAWRARAVPPPAGAKPPFVAILIDDAGLDRKDTERAIALPGPITLSFMSYANDLAVQSKAARAAGHELMLHMPMEPLDLQHNDPGPNALLVKLDKSEIRRRVMWDLDRFDGYVGVNNHMGSRFTRDRERMSEVMSALRDRQVFWLDSLSGPGSVGAEEARRAGLDAVERDLFLDDSHSPGIAYELAAMERVARARGDVIAIGHPHPGTLSALEKWIASAKEKGFSLVPVSTVLLRRQQMEQ